MFVTILYPVSAFTGACVQHMEVLTFLWSSPVTLLVEEIAVPEYVLAVQTVLQKDLSLCILLGCVGVTTVSLAHV